MCFILSKHCFSFLFFFVFFALYTLFVYIDRRGKVEVLFFLRFHWGQGLGAGGFATVSSAVEVEKRTQCETAVPSVSAASQQAQNIIIFLRFLFFNLLVSFLGLTVTHFAPSMRTWCLIFWLGQSASGFPPWMFTENTAMPHSHSTALIALGKLPGVGTGLTLLWGTCGSNNNVEEVCSSDCWKPVSQLLTDPWEIGWK